jgi:hypothetical protein
MQAIHQAARELDIVIAIRPVKTVAQGFIEAGYPTKPYSVKNKTSDVGIAAGLIVINPEFSQLNKKEYFRYRHQLRKAFKKDASLSEMTCVLPEHRLHQLKSLLGDAIQIQFSADKQQCDVSWNSNDKNITVIAKKNLSAGDYTIYDDKGFPLQVLAKQIVDSHGEKMLKPITSDYDLLAICPSYGDLDLRGKDKTPFSTQGSLRRIQWIVRASKFPFYTGPKEDPARGNMNERTEQVLETINKYIKKMDVHRRGCNLETVHHGAELQNPFARDLSNNLPALFILPHEWNHSSPYVLVENEVELQNFCEKLHGNHYYWPPHSKYPDLIPEAYTNSSNSGE